MSSMKAETCDQEHRSQPATPVYGVPTSTTAAGWTKTWLCWVIAEYFHQSDKKNVFWLILFKNTHAYSFMWIAIHCIYCINTYRSDKISVLTMHWWIVTHLITKQEQSKTATWTHSFQRKSCHIQQAVPINGDNIPPLWSVPTPSRNTQQIVLFLSDCGSYTGENHSRKICLRRISAWLCPLECHGMEGIEAAVDTKSLGNVKKRFRKKLRKPRFSVNFWPPEGQKWGHEHENR